MIPDSVVISNTEFSTEKYFTKNLSVKRIPRAWTIVSVRRPGQHFDAENCLSDWMARNGFIPAKPYHLRSKRVYTAQEQGIEFYICFEDSQDAIEFIMRDGKLFLDDKTFL